MSTTSITRTLKYAVDFEGVERFSKPYQAIHKILCAAETDLRMAANQALAAMYLMRMGTLPTPLNKDKPVSVRTLAYQAFSGKWQPFGEVKGALYQAKMAPRLSSRILLHASGVLFTRASTDLAKVESGECQLPTFRRFPVGTVAQALTFDPETLALSFQLWGAGVDGPVLPKLLPHRLRGEPKALLQRIAQGEVKAGNASLTYDDRTKKWMLCLSWTGPVKVVASTTVAGIDLGQIIEVTMGYSQGSHTLPFKDFVPFPEDALRAWDRIREQNRKAQQFGRDPSRKLARVVRTSVEQLAARVVQVALQRRAGLVVLEDLKGFTSDMLASTEAITASRRAKIRMQWLRWHYGAVREQVRHVALKRGSRVAVVAPHYSSCMCATCGQVWLGPEEKPALRKIALKSLQTLSATLYLGNKVKKVKLDREIDPAKLRFGPYGRISAHQFTCDCGVNHHSKVNAAHNLAAWGEILLPEFEGMVSETSTQDEAG